MTDSSRRTFLKSAAVVSAVGLSGRSLAEAPNEPSAQAAARPDSDLLRALATVVLPVSALGSRGVERVVADFERWLEEFEPVAELSHGYLNRGLAEIRYGPPHPGPRWTAQLEALELEARKRHGSSFSQLSAADKRSLIRRQIRRDSLDRLPGAAQARHVAVGLVAYFYATSEANDLCHRAAIGRHSCRGLEDAAEAPTPLETGA